MSSDSDAIKHREFEVEYYKGDEHPSREAFFQGGCGAVDCDDDEEGGFGPTNTEGSNSKWPACSNPEVGDNFQAGVPPRLSTAYSQVFLSSPVGQP